LTTTLESAPEQQGLQVTAPALDLLEPVVRAIQQMGRQKRSDTRAQTHEHVQELTQGGIGNSTSTLDPSAPESAGALEQAA
jgi:hypothetical protein